MDMYFAKNGHHGGGGLGIGLAVTPIILISLAFALLMIAAAWRLFSKAGQPGWAAIIPFYNTIVSLRIAGRPGWWLLLMFIPLVNVVVAIIFALDLAKSFGKGTGFGVLTFLFPVICIPILGFGGARYVGPGGQSPHAGQSYSDEASTARFAPH
ncbi:DUF5684 domain-containing protein [Saccharopolyspora oryzae]|uniref:DUF5684 domain-containing protein n=1 Tax=Saccharopolyspora oryzae TaxID=2997343 RepID=A0ABT4V0T4_9PSEU|nr:DUF5684 domain-containing protein [Saccharopolyspora oryzae]MDA3627567.1 DUF5684 domain-containing protein [Saccharopolyspora oryzae]